jgi:hypothetical protein
MKFPVAVHMGMGGAAPILLLTQNKPKYAK